MTPDIPALVRFNDLRRGVVEAINKLRLVDQPKLEQVLRILKDPET